MKSVVDKGQFYDLFKQRALVVTALPAGHPRELAERANEAAGRGDASLHTRAEYAALFDLLATELSRDGAAALRLRDDQGRPTAAGQAVDDYLAASTGTDEFFDQSMHLVRIEHWGTPGLLEDEVRSSGAARLSIWPTDPADHRHVPPPDEHGVLFTTTDFSLVNSGNRTLRVPKRSWKIRFEAAAADDRRFAGFTTLNLKAMYNDPSQMREALAWRMFGRVGVPAARHTYAKLAFDDRYFGLFSMIEQVDGRFLHRHFGRNDEGNLYKAYCGDLGAATLEHRVGRDGDDSGRQYASPPDSTDATYRLKSNEDDMAANTYDDLAALVRTINGVGLPGGDRRFDTDAFAESVARVLNARCFLRWAGANLLIGSWDNYFATPANYYLYNSGYRGASVSDLVHRPYFTFVPWDYDNSFGIDYFDTRWQYTDLVDWPGNTDKYAARNHHPHSSRIPLVTNLLHNTEFLRYYLDHLEHLLDTSFTVEAIRAEIGPDGGGLWDRVSQPAYLEADTPYAPPYTGRQFTNDEVYLNACKQTELRKGNCKIEGIEHYVRMRYDSAREQLAELRKAHPRGSSGAEFTGTMEPLPEG